jgi:ATP-dependent Clp protease ATP-binding subunit ClpA
MTGIDVASMTEEDGQKLLGLEDGIHRRVVGQATAVKALAKAVRRARVGRCLITIGRVTKLWAFFKSYSK